MTTREFMAKVVAISGVTMNYEQLEMDSMAEWKKWLAYDPDFQRNKRRTISNRSDISKEDSKYLLDYLDNQLILDLLNKYGSSFIARADSEKLSRFLNRTSIEEYMINKLSNDEKEYASYVLKECSTLSDEQLRAKVAAEIKPGVYQHLSMVDSYILHMLYKDYNNRGLNKLEEEVVSEYFKNQGVRRRRIYLDNN